MQQRSKEWFDVRKGRFTGSRISELLIGGRRNMTADELETEKKNKGKKKTINTMFGDTALNYIFEKACEIVFGINQDDNLETFDIKRGIELEPLAFRQFQELKSLEFIEADECSFFAYGDNSGASPDGLVGKDAVLEIKCPRPVKFFMLVKQGEKVIDKVYIAQMQWQMKCTNSARCHFFNYIIYNGKPMWHEIVIDRDDKIIDLIENRIEEAVIIRDHYIKELNEKRQF